MKRFALLALCFVISGLWSNAQDSTRERKAIPVPLLKADSTIINHFIEPAFEFEDTSRNIKRELLKDSCWNLTITTTNNGTSFSIDPEVKPAINRDINQIRALHGQFGYFRYSNNLVFVFTKSTFGSFFKPTGVSTTFNFVFFPADPYLVKDDSPSVMHLRMKVTNVQLEPPSLHK